MDPRPDKANRAARDASNLEKRDVEKRWRDPPTLRAATLYVVGVSALAIVAAIVYLSVDRTNVLLAGAVPGAFFVGGIGALIMGYRTYRRGGTWIIWQGAAWALLALMLVALWFPTTLQTTAL